VLTLGEAEAMRIRAMASANMITAVGESIKAQGVHGKDALALTVAEQYIAAFGELAKEGTTVVTGNLRRLCRRTSATRLEWLLS
jgi:C-terminal region of band_7